MPSVLWTRAARFRALLVLALAGLLPGCATAPPSRYAGAEPGDRSARTAPVSYRTPLASYVSRRPADAALWRTPERAR